MTRYFTIVEASAGKLGGRYATSDSPCKAAKKAARQLFRRADGKTFVSFAIRETTRGSGKTIYRYQATLERYDVPQYVSAGDAEIDVTKRIRIARVSSSP